MRAREVRESIRAQGMLVRVGTRKLNDVTCLWQIEQKKRKKKKCRIGVSQSDVIDKHTDNEGLFRRERRRKNHRGDCNPDLYYCYNYLKSTVLGHGGFLVPKKPKIYHSWFLKI